MKFQFCIFINTFIAHLIFKRFIKPSPISRHESIILEKLQATHVVTGMDLGGSMLGSIKITQRNKGNQYKIGFWLEGVIDLKLVAAKLSANASVGEEVVTENYESTITLKSMPPIEVPTSITDFGSNSDQLKSDIGSKFESALKKQNHFEIWDHLLGPRVKVTGIPVRFYLKPLDLVFDVDAPDPEPDPGTDPESEPEPDPELEPVISDPEESDGEITDLEEPDIDPITTNRTHPAPFNHGSMETLQQKTEAVLKMYSTIMSNFHLWSGLDFFKRELLNSVPRIQTIISEPNHVLSQYIIKQETALIHKTSPLKILGSDNLMEYKQRQDEAADEDFLAATNNLVFQWRLIDKDNKDFVKEIDELAKAEMNAVHVTPQDEEDSDEDDPEDTSPLVYFTSKSELNSWISTSRYSKLLYRGNLEIDKPKIPQRLYNMSQTLGKMGIQPAISYPSLSENFRNFSKSVSNSNPELFLIICKTEIISYTLNEEDKVEFILNAIDDCTGSPEDGDRKPVAIHLYNALSEINGTKLNFSPADMSQLIELLLITLQSTIFCRNVFQTRSQIESTVDEGPKIIITSDGLKSSIPVMRSLKILQGQTNPTPIVCGTFNIILPDTPLFFIARNGRVEGVCLDHLDLFIYIDSDSIDTALEVLNMSNFDKSPICPKGRIEFAHKVRENPKEVQLLQRRQNIGENHLSRVARISESVINSKIQTTKDFIDQFTALTIKYLGNVYDDSLEGWNPDKETFEYDIGESDNWKETMLKVDILAEQNTDSFPYFHELLTTKNTFASATVAPVRPVPGIIPVPDPPEPDFGLFPDPDKIIDKPRPPPNRQDLEDVKNLFVVNYRKDISPELQARFAHVNPDNFPYIHDRALARIYGNFLNEETFIEEIEKNEGHIYSIRQLSRVIGEVGASGAVSEERMHLVMGQSLENGAKEVVKPMIWEQIETFFKLKRYYNVVNLLAENNPEEYQNDNGELILLQLELQKLTSTRDWYQLTNLISQLSPQKEEQHFSFRSQEIMWKNEKYQHLILANISHGFVLAELRKAYVIREEEQAPYCPPYIPRNIAIILLYEEGNPIDGGVEDPWEEIIIPEIWHDEKELLKLLKRLAVVQYIPKSFARILLLNVIKEENTIIKDALDSVACLHYWDENDKLFNQPWDLETIESTIESLMQQHDAKVNIGPAHDNRIPSPSAVELIDVIKTHSDKPALTFVPNLRALAKRPVQDLSRLSEKDRLHLFDNIQSINKSQKMDLLKLAKNQNLALPLVVKNVGQDKSLPYVILPFLSTTGHQFLFGKPLGRIVTLINIGKCDNGKSQFLNKLFQNQDNFITNHSTIYDEFVEYIELNESLFSSELQMTCPQFQSHQTLTLLNVHGDALALDNELLSFLKMITSSFIVCWYSPTNGDQIRTKERDLMSTLRPHYSVVNLYFDVYPDPNIPESAIIKSPFDTNHPNFVSNCTNFATALSIAANESPKELDLWSDLSPSPYALLSFSKTVQELSELVDSATISRVKNALLLHNNVKPMTITDFENYWSINHLYADIVMKMSNIFNEPNFEDALYDLHEMLEEMSQNSTSTNYQGFLNLSSQDDKEWIKSFPILEKRNLLSRIKLDIYQNQLSLSDLLIETCRAAYLAPHLVPIESSKISAIILSQFASGQGLEVPISPETKSYFGEEWVHRAISYEGSPNERYFVVNCIGTNGHKMFELFTSGFKKQLNGNGNGKARIITDFHLRLLQFDQELKDEYEVDGILFVLSRPICQSELYDNPNYLQYDQKLLTFLLSSANLTMVLDFEDADFKTILHKCILDMSRVPDSVGNILFVGGIEQEIISFLTSAEISFQEMPLLESGDTTVLGQTILSQALQNIERGMGHVNDQNDNNYLFNAILKHVSQNKAKCPTFKGYCENFQNLWTTIDTQEPFKFKDFEDMKAISEFNAKVNTVCAKIDDSFHYHTEDLHTLLYQGLMSLKEYLGDPEYQTGKEQVLAEVSMRINSIFETCGMGSEIDNELGTRFKPITTQWRLGLSYPKSVLKSETHQSEPTFCKPCATKKAVQDTILDQIEDHLKGDFHIRIRSYIAKDSAHFLHLLNQMADSMELKIQAEEEEESRNIRAELSELQWTSLSRLATPSRRRALIEFQETFPLLRDAYQEQNYESFEDLCINEEAYNQVINFEDYDVPLDDHYLSWQEISWLEFNLSVAITQIVPFPPAAIFQSGMIRSVKANLEEVFNNFSLRFSKYPSPPFRNSTIIFCVREFVRNIGSKEAIWNKEYEPITVWKEIYSDV